MAKAVLIDTADDGQDDFEDIVDSPYGAEHASRLVGSGDQNDGETEFVIQESGSAEDNAFDKTVGVLQEVVLSDAFQALLEKFYKENCHHFEDTEENKLIYTDIFTKYSELIEGYLEQQLSAAIQGFSMASFLEELVKRGEEEVDNSVFDLLVSLSDFDSFKAQMIAEKAPQDKGLSVAGTASKIYQDEDEDGEERPDLADLLVVTPATPKKSS